MIRTSLTTALLIITASVAQAEPEDVYANQEAMTSARYFTSGFTGATLLIAKGDESKGKKDKGNGGEKGGRKGKDDDGNKGNANKGDKQGKAEHGKEDQGGGHNKKYPGVEYGKRLFANSGLPVWAHDCGLPPGLAKQNKIPPGWEKKCRGGLKYYDNPDAFRLDLFDFYGVRVGADVTLGSPIYRSLHSMDEADCQVKSMVSAGDVVEGAAVGAVYGGLLGAGAGAAVGAVTDNDVGDSALTGAGAGALTGAVIGGIVASQDYHDDYDRCMRKHGY